VVLLCGAHLFVSLSGTDSLIVCVQESYVWQTSALSLAFARFLLEISYYLKVTAEVTRLI